MKSSEINKYLLILIGICSVLFIISYLNSGNNSILTAFYGNDSLRMEKSYQYPDVNDGGIIDYLSTLESRVDNDENDIEIVAWR